MTGHRKIALIGAMGSGKSALSRRLTAKYGATAVDTDAEFTRRYGDINAFFAAHGEAEFRKRERDIIIDAAYSDADVVATGGGAVLSREGMNALRRTRDVVYLTAPTATLKARVMRSDRPLKADFDKILSRRKALYEAYADYTVSSEFNSIDEFERELAKPRGNRFDAVLCDADDTLLDFKRAMRYAVVEAARALGITKSDDEIVSKYAEVTRIIWSKLERGEITRAELNHIRFRLLGEMLGEAFDYERMNDTYIEYMRGTRFVIDGAIELLNGLRARGIKVYIITNSFTRVASERLKAIADYADGAFISEEVGYDKPRAEFFERVLESVGSPDKSRTLVFGDSETSDVAGGRNSGLWTCLYGERADTAADFSVKSLCELLDIV